MFGKRLASLRKKMGISQYELADRLGFSRGQLANYEQGKRQPDFDTLQKIADFFEVSTDYLLGRSENKKSDWDSKLPELTEKDEKDIAKRMDKIKEDLKKAKDTDGLNFYGEPMSEEAIESLLEAIEYAERQTVRINKKYTPKKYRKNE